MKNKLIVIILFAILPLKAYAIDFHPIIGISSIYTDINDPNFRYTDKFNFAKALSINLGASLSYNNFIVGAATNRLSRRLLNTSEREVKDKNNYKFQSLTEYATDSVFIGYQIKRFQPALFLTNARIEKSLYKNDTLLIKTRQNAILYGASLGYFLTRNIQANLIYIAPNKELYLESGFGLGLNYIF